MLWSKNDTMALSKEKFVEFLQKRLTTESAKSYLDYVEAFKRAIKQKDDYLFNGEIETKNYLKKFLNKQAHPPAFREFKKNYQDNIRVGIRSLLLYYLFEEEIAKRKSEKRKELLTLRLESFLNDFEFWLTHRYLKQNGEKFKSGKQYANYIKAACIDNNTEISKFIQIEKSSELKKFMEKLELNSNFKSRPKHTQQNIMSGLRKYELFLSEFYGEQQLELYAA